MRAIVREAVEAGALGVTTSRVLGHRAMDGEPVPGTFAAHDELFALGYALRDAGTGVFELAPAGADGQDVIKAPVEMAWMRKLSAEIGRPVTFGMNQVLDDPEQWRMLLEESLAGLWRRIAVLPPGGGPALRDAPRPADPSRLRQAPHLQGVGPPPAARAGRPAARARGPGGHPGRGEPPDQPRHRLGRGAGGHRRLPAPRLPTGHHSRLRAAARRTRWSSWPRPRGSLPSSCSTT